MSPPADEVAPVYAVIGRDRFLRRCALDRIHPSKTDAADAFGPTYFDGSQANLADVLDEVRTLSLLGPRRVVIVDEADPWITRHRASLERYTADPSDTGCLILLCGSLPRNTRLYKAISKHGIVVHCDPPKGRAVTQWLIQHASAEYEKRLSPAAAQRLRDHIGDAPGTLDAELSKLAAFVGKRTEIRPDDIEALTGNRREEKVFAVTDAISAGDVAAALRYWEQVLATDRAAPGRAIAGLAWGVRRLLEARRDWEEGTSIQELSRRLYTDPSVLQRRLKSVSVEQLELRQRDLLIADAAVKTGASTLSTAVERFIVKHCAISSGQRPEAATRKRA